MTKKELLERLRDAPDDALIGGMQTFDGIVYVCAWIGDNDDEYNIVDIMQGVKIVPCKNVFSLEDFK